MREAGANQRVLVLGAGNFGTCLAQHLAQLGHDVTIWTRSTAVCDAINSSHKNPKYLRTINLSQRVSATHKIDQGFLGKASAVVQAIPTQGMRQVFNLVKPFWHADLLLICAAKGIEVTTHQLPGGIIADVLGAQVARDAVFLSGPSFAIEVAGGQPTAVAAASRQVERAKRAQALFHSPRFRVYTSEDPVGLEVAGALKNVVAIAAGASVGLGFQMNSRAALITRGLAEISRFGAALGAQPQTFNGLGGVGDLFLTCTSEKSRNFTVGYLLGQGRSLASVLKEVGSVAEGVATAKAAFELSEKLGVDAPITGAVYRVLYESQPIDQAVQELLTREAKPEIT